MDFIRFITPQPYEACVSAMEQHVAAIRAGTVSETVWVLEHPSLYTAGTSAKEFDLIEPLFPVFHTGRGGQYTYHGPGQMIAYIMVDLAARGGDVRLFVWQLEESIIRTLAEFDIIGERRSGRIGIWVVTPQDKQRVEQKIAAIGVRVRSGVTYHGLSINLNPALAHYQGIVPCGLNQYGVTSIHALGKQIHSDDLYAALQKNLTALFN
jgi:lipoyl(octanoyl) transferase